jgi:hypothetical protein
LTNTSAARFGSGLSDVESVIGARRAHVHAVRNIGAIFARTGSCLV